MRQRKTHANSQRVFCASDAREHVEGGVARGQAVKIFEHEAKQLGLYPGAPSTHRRALQSMGRFLVPSRKRVLTVSGSNRRKEQEDNSRANARPQWAKLGLSWWWWR